MLFWGSYREVSQRMGQARPGDGLAILACLVPREEGPKVSTLRTSEEALRIFCDMVG